jgi:DNA polymerase I-like protein with 3'-5' exonuclease and polymerase domains
MSTQPLTAPVQVLPTLDLKTVKGFAPQLVTDGAGLDKIAKFIKRIATGPRPAWNTQPTLGLDTETNITVDFFTRRIRTIQVGDAFEQYCVDLLMFADGNSEKMMAAQGAYGANSAIFAPIRDLLSPVLCTNNFLKVGMNLPFEYEVLYWNLGMRIWNLYSIDLVERVIKAGAHSLKDYPYFSMASIFGRYFNKLIDKTLQSSFDMSTPLTQDQVDYATFDTFGPLAVRQKQLPIIEKDRLSATSQIENDALGSYTDMHLNGQRMDGARWMVRINASKERLVETLKELDTFFVPVVGSKIEAMDTTVLEMLEKKWKDLGVADEEERDACAAYKAVSAKKDPVLRAQLKAKFEALEQNRKDLKAAARVTHGEVSKRHTKVKNLAVKCQGEALINYNSGKQLLAAFKNMRGFTTLDATDKDTLLKYNDKPMIQALLRLSKLKKDIGTYGEQWTKPWVNKPCKEEGWLHPGDGRLHCVFNQLEAETGRSSSSKPNAQNLPKDDEVRACFICDPPNPNVRVSVCCDADTEFKFNNGNGAHVCLKCLSVCETKDEEMCIVTCDMAGAELRIIAELANAASWINAFAKGHDVHSVGTEIMYPEKWPHLTIKSLAKPEYWTVEDVETESIPLFSADGSPLMKKGKHVHVPPCAYFAHNAAGDLARLKCDCPEHKKLRDGNKSTNFLLAYGGGPSALAEAIGISVDDAKLLMKLHESKFPDIWGYLKRSGEQARFKKEARDLFGRRRLFPDPTWDGAREFFIQEHSDRLELDEEDAEANILAFKKKLFEAGTPRELDDDEEYRLTHREPSTKEISSAYKGMFGSIERRGKNHCIQGSNASIIKRAMGWGFDKNGKGYLWHLLPQYKAKLLSMVHDELIVQCPKRFGDEVARCIADAFKRAAAEVMSKVVMEADWHIAERWMK